MGKYFRDMDKAQSRNFPCLGVAMAKDYGRNVI